MKFYLTLCLLWLGVNAEKKINLEDIERDNLRAEGLSKSGNSRVEETKYLTKEIGQQYQISNQYRGHPASSPVTFVTPSPQNAPSEAYNVQFNKYAKEQVYQPQNNVLPEQILPPRYYNEYQQQPPRGIAPNVYESQQLAYQPEVNVGNRLQAVQQKVVTAKYTKSPNKDTVYVNIPMMHFLTYYPNLRVGSGKGGEFLLPQLSAASTEHISIPVYSSALSQKPIVPGKPTYQIQYAPKHNAAPVAFSTKVTKGAAYTTPVTSKKFTSSPLANAQSYAPSDQTFAQGRQLLYTQAYVSPSSQPQYVPQLVYAQPTTTVYMHATPVYNPVYARAPAYVQDNSLQANVNYAISSEQLDATVADELPDQVLAHQPSAQNYVKDSDEPNTDLTPPQAPAQDFKSGAQTVIQVSEEEESIPEQNQVGLGEPRSLLDSYVPSKLIAAQDSARYQERPIKLESGFLPSKENFLYKKRKSE
ncbi:uncharacterized protein LOC108625454 [Ceratina calcarata]|uniref:Uncharacterized protein LOC108625454 n=1 Tax=Ceratina calcarata TaxID=156304 RepID=A0AAJ7S268_9HYME|nr:uncharacterized protein LOC108625454 [Ceratina calcarata]